MEPAREIKFIRNDEIIKDINELQRIVKRVNHPLLKPEVRATARFMAEVIIAAGKGSAFKSKLSVDNFDRSKLNFLIQPPRPVRSVSKIYSDEIPIPSPSEVDSWEEKLHEIGISPLVIMKGESGEELIKSYVTENEEGALIYNVEETEVDEDLLLYVKNSLFSEFIRDNNIIKSRQIVEKNVREGSSLQNKKFDNKIFDKINYYIMRDLIGFGKIEPLIKDQKITYLKCDGLSEPVIIMYEDKLEMDTNIVFVDKDEMMNLIYDLANKIKKDVSEEHPVAKGNFHNLFIKVSMKDDKLSFEIRKMKFVS